MKERIILSILVMSVFADLSCKSYEQTPKKAASEYCSCLKAHEPLGKLNAREFCDSLIKKYKYLKIYLETRDTSMSDLYDKEFIEKVLEFNWEFAKEVDDCSPPFWFKEE